MRTAFLGSVLIFAFAGCAAQGAAGVPAQMNPREVASSQETSSSSNIIVYKTRTLLPKRYYILPGEIAGFGTGVCYTMRSYLFTPSKNGAAPHPAGYTTCTPSKQLEMRQTKRPRARFLPQ